MALLEAARTQVRIWTAYSHLNAADNAERRRAIGALADLGPVALPCLRFASGPLRPARVQYGAAVALHQLGEPDGLVVLCNALRWHLPARPELQSELEAAFFDVGAPDAVSALIELFPHLAARDPQIMGCVCNIWAELRDPRALDILTDPAWLLPDLFVATVPAFGHMAIVHLERMTREPDPNRRLLAISALRLISVGRSLDVLRPLLCDPDPKVRGAVPQAMFAIEPSAAIGAVARSVRDGYSSAEAVEILARNATTVADLLLELVCRWDPLHPDTMHDTAEAVMAALPLLSDAPMPNTVLIPPLCALLDRQPDAVMTAAIVRLIGTRVQFNDECTTLVCNALSTRIAHSDKDVRQETGRALSRIGEPLGRELNQWLAECWPQGNLLTRLHAILRGGPDAGQAATQAMQQVTQWFNRLSREAADRLSSGSQPGATASSRYDIRLPEVLRQLLSNGLSALRSELPADRTEEALSLCIATMRALERIGAPDALCAYDELVAALDLVKYRLQSAAFGSYINTERREIGEVVRATAASLLLQCFGPDSYGLFLGALHSPQREVHRTAILALSRLGDPRALPFLQTIAANAADPNADVAMEAIATIRRTNPEVMTLLRASHHGDSRPDTLLRPANGNNANAAPDLLLRPTASGPVYPTTPTEPSIACDSSN